MHSSARAPRKVTRPSPSRRLNRPQLTKHASPAPPSPRLGRCRHFDSEISRSPRNLTDLVEEACPRVLEDERRDSAEAAAACEISGGGGERGRGVKTQGLLGLGPSPASPPHVLGARAGVRHPPPVVRHWRGRPASWARPRRGLRRGGCRPRRVVDARCRAVPVVGAAPPSLDEAERARYARGAPLDHEMGDYFVQQDPFRV